MLMLQPSGIHYTFFRRPVYPFKCPYYCKHSINTTRRLTGIYFYYFFEFKLKKGKKELVFLNVVLRFRECIRKGVDWSLG